MGFIYCFFSLRFLYFKIGLSKTPRKRLRNIRETVRDDLKKYPVIIPLFVIIVWDMETVEKAIHGVIDFWNFTWKGSGKSEWFKSKLFFIDVFFALFIALVLMILFQLESILRIGIVLATLVLIIYLIVV